MYNFGNFRKLQNDEDLHCSSGPVSSMPGSSHPFPKGSVCDVHGDIPAVKRIQGETDSFGCEYVLMCQGCVDEHQKYLQAKQEEEECCDWCKQMKKGLRPHRDMDEGMSGPLYDVCSDCIIKENEEARRELEENGGYSDDLDWD